MRTLRQFPLWLLLALLAGCVTINVYFPAAAAEQAADRIIRDVYGVPRQEETPPQEQPTPEPQKDSLYQESKPLWVALLEWTVTPAQAAADINVQSPAINRLRAQMKARHQQLLPFYQQGAVGIAADGELRIRDMNAVSLPDRARVKQLVEQENRDRQALYAEIARVNGHPEWQDEIRATFSRRWIDNAPSGWWYQDKSGGWKRK